MASQTPTLKQIAQLAGCTLSAASTVLNRARGNSGVSKETSERIVRVARELGYRPNFAASSLMRRSTRTVGVYFGSSHWANFGNPYYEASLMRGVEISARERNYDLLLLNVTGNSPASVCVRKIEESRIDGLILIHVEPDADFVQELLGATNKLVAIDCLDNVQGVDLITFDNDAAIELAIQHLQDLGHRSIGFLGPCLATNSAHSMARTAAFGRFLASQGIPIDSGLIHGIQHLRRPIREDEEFCQLEGAAGMRHFLAMGTNRPTALVAYNDLVAAGAYDVLSSKGLVAGRDVSIIGVDDSALCRHLRPPLTSIRHPLEEMAYMATGRLIEKIEGVHSSVGDGLVPAYAPKLVTRKSTVANQ